MYYVVNMYLEKYIKYSIFSSYVPFKYIYIYIALYKQYSLYVECVTVSLWHIFIK